MSTRWEDPIYRETVLAFARAEASKIVREGFNLCPICGALGDSRCRTAGGRARKDHSRRPV